MTTTASTHRRTGAPPRRGLAVFAAVNALSAYAGAVALATGLTGVGDRLNARLPFDSPVFGAVALILIVAVPMTVLARAAWQGDRRTDSLAVLAGALLVGWIVVELGFLRELSFFQPAYAAIGAGLVLAGLRGLRAYD